MLAGVILSILLVLCFRFLPPPTSAFMIGRYLEGAFEANRRTPIQYSWQPLESISPHMALAVVASEDQKFPKHWGFDFDSIAHALDGETGRLRGASTISQQTAKNLFLWSGRSYIRKGLEAYYTGLMELFWPKKRMLEVYLNIAEFGDCVYGVAAASKAYFGKNPSRLTRNEAALLAAVLPNPRKHKVKSSSAYVRARAKRIERQMRNLGDGYLRRVIDG